MSDNKPDLYKEVPNASINADVPKKEVVYSTSYKENYNSAAKDYWTQLNLGESYNAGSIGGKLGKNELNVTEFFSRIFSIIKQSIVSDLRKRNLTSETLKDDFIVLDHQLKILARDIDLLGQSNLNSILAEFHGFVNSYIESVKNKLEDTNEKKSG